jgi:hypothetical protein
MYKLINDRFGNLACILRTSDNASIPIDQDNSDYQAFLKYQAEGGVVLPADDNEQAS